MNSVLSKNSEKRPCINLKGKNVDSSIAYVRYPTVGLDAIDKTSRNANHHSPPDSCPPSFAPRLGFGRRCP
jgi:hypothetical protein